MLDQFFSPAGRLSYKARPQAQTQQARNLSLLDWTLQHRALLAPERPFTAYPHLAALYADDAREIVIYKAAQLGASEYLISWMLYAADVKNATGLYVFPTDTHVSDFSAARLGPAIEASVSPYLASIIVGGDEHGADRVGLKRVHNRFIYFRGAKVSPDGRAPQLRSIDADALVLDEYDEMDSRAAPISRQRLAASKFAQVRIASTPTYPEVGIHGEYLKSDCRQWFIPCLACGKAQAPTLDDLIIEYDGLQRPTKWNINADGRAFLKCKLCGGALDRESGRGEWVAEYPGREIRGYHLFRLSLPGRSLETILDELNTTDETKRQQAFNQGLGLPYTPSTAQAMTDSILDNARRDYGLGIPTDPTLARELRYAGIDVGRVLHVTIRAFHPNGERPLRYAGEVNSFDEAARLMEQFNVRTCVVDALPETRAARNFQAKFASGKVWLSFFGGTDASAKKESVATWNNAEGTVNVDRTRALDAMFALIYDASNKQPGNTLPANARDICDYYAHLKAPKRILRADAKGVQVAAYVESAPDHFSFSEAYNFIASVCPYGAGWARGAG